MSQRPQPTACIVVIGNEILSGRTQDKNTHWLAGELGKIGIAVLEARVVPDIKEKIVQALNEVSPVYDLIFTTGGIGPTHDDITAESVAAWAGVPVVLHAQAHQRLKVHYGDQLNTARLKMAHLPEGATLIDNPVSAAPGFRIRNVHVMAGIPSIMQVMFDSIRGTLKGSTPTISLSVSALVTEGIIALELAAIQQRYPDIDIGSYPFIKDNKLGVSIVLRGLEMPRLEAASGEVQTLLSTKGELFAVPLGAEAG